MHASQRIKLLGPLRRHVTRRVLAVGRDRVVQRAIDSSAITPYFLACLIAFGTAELDLELVSAALDKAGQAL
jgi:hypothetical protein